MSTSLSEFSGGVFSKEIDGGRAGASIALVPEGIVAHTTTGQRFVVRYHECQLEMGGASGRMVFCRPPDRSVTIFCEDKGFPRALATASGSELAGDVDHMLEARQRERGRGRGWFLIGAGVLAILLIAGYYGVMAAGRAVLMSVPVSVDRTIGDQAFGAMEKPGPEIHDPVVVDAIAEIVDRLGEQANAPLAADEQFDFRVHVIDADVMNAFALPGGQIVVFTGLIQACNEPEQLAGVLAHEMSHVTRRHGLERIGQSLGLALAVDLVLGRVEGLATAAVQLAQLAAANSYSRDQEAQADADGVQFMHAAGLDPLALAKFFERLKEEGPGLPGALEWISTHPDHDRRIKAVESQTAALPPLDPRPLKLDWAEVQAHAKNPE
ncbi:MAG: peptidase M48 [Planctomycetaceae bacterium]|nr:peptidase M48 [Planctomycetaceae bacterium]